MVILSYYYFGSSTYVLIIAWDLLCTLDIVFSECGITSIVLILFFPHSTSRTSTFNSIQIALTLYFAWLKACKKLSG
jgi:hypothetical protein